MVAKRKTVSALAMKVAQFTSKDDADEEMDLQIVPVAVECKEPSERDLVETRTKELKAIGAGDLKELLSSNGLATGTKEIMIKALLKHEAKARAAALEQKGKIRAVVVKKKQELEGLSTSELSKLCDSMGAKGLRSKEERVQHLLIQWQQNGGVDNALAEIAQQQRKQDLDALDNSKLQKLCTKVGVDPFVKEIMVDRIIKQESSSGCYSRPALPQEHGASNAADKPGDMVDSLLANEAQRKKDKELKSLQEEAAAKKQKELKALSVEELKKRLTKKGLDASGKKDDMLQALFIAGMQEEAANAKKAELQSKSLQDLKELLSHHSLDVGSKENMIKTMLAHEAKCRENVAAFEAKVSEGAQQRKKELETETNAALKELCEAKGLPVGGGKEEKVERLIEEALRERDLDKLVSRNIRSKRQEELMSLDKQAVVSLCEQAGVDPVVKDIMVERIISHESEDGEVIAMTDAEPAAKRARVSKK